LYNQILHQIVIPLTGNKVTNSTDLHKVGKQLLGNKFIGVFPSDMIPKLTLKTPYCIVNVDSSDLSGSHWMSLVKSGRNETILYDSFGRSHVKILPSLKLSGNGKAINTDLDREQGLKEESCGARSIGFLLFYDKYGRDMSLLI
jgi:hypothetical protein